MTDICRNIIMLQTVMIRNNIDSLSLELAGALQANGMNIRTMSPEQIEQWDMFAEVMSERLIEDGNTTFTLHDLIRTRANNPDRYHINKHLALKKDWDNLYRDIIEATKNRLNIKDNDGMVPEDEQDMIRKKDVPEDEYGMITEDEDDDNALPTHVVYCQNSGCEYNESGVCHTEGFVQLDHCR